jgi:serine/threonine-protein kinase
VPPNDPFGLIGQVLDGQFHVEEYVGEGGFSSVYKGTSVGLNEPIAVKCLKLPQALGSALVESFVKRFRDESRIHYKLSQGNLHIARSIASGTTIAPTTSALVPYTVLEWLEGRSLAEDLNDRRQQRLTGRPLAEVVKLLDSAIDALAYAHSQGVVHRDLNPGNLFLAKTPAGIKLKVLDFGVAKILADSALAMGPAARTMGNVRMFAPAYGAPEQFDENVGPIGPWTDVYAVALVTMEALRDHTVMEGEHIGEFAMKTLDPNNRPTPRALGISVGDAVEGVFARATALDPRERPQDAGELWGMLKHAVSVDGQSGRKAHSIRAPSMPPPGPPDTQRVPERVPEGAESPIIELSRPPTNPPPGAPSGARAHGGTLRMSGAPQSGTQALATTPAPRGVAAGARPLVRTQPMTASSSGISSISSISSTSSPGTSGITPTPGFRGPSASASSSQPRRSPVALYVVLVLVVLGALGYGAWLLVARSHHASLSAVPSSWT